MNENKSNAVTLVMAPSYARYVGYKIENIPLRKCKYIHEIKDILGYKNCEMIILSGSLLIPKYFEILDFAKSRNIKIKEED